MAGTFSGFASVWLVDFEYSFDRNGLPLPFCMVARNFFTGSEYRLWGEELTRRTQPPFPIGPYDVFVCYAATAEASAFLALGWPQPVTIFDAYVEYLHVTNGRPRPPDNKLPSVLQYFSLPHMDVMEKKEFQQRCIQGPPFTAEEREALLDYCAEDCTALQRLLPALGRFVSDFPQAFLRGRYMWALAHVQRVGIPMDYDGVEALHMAGDTLIQTLIDAYDRPYGAFQQGHFSHTAWLRWCDTNGIEWPRTKTGLADTKGSTFTRMKETDTRIAPMAELQASLDQIKRHALRVHPDGRHRPWLNPFATLTSRNMPSPSQYIFSLPAWMRGYLQAPEGHEVILIDWSGQEIGIAAAYSGDRELMRLYNTGDPHSAFGQRIGLIPVGIPVSEVKRTYAREREICKTLLFGVNYGMTFRGFARKAKLPLPQAQFIVNQHRRIFRQFWTWVDDILERAFLEHAIRTCFGWTYHIQGRRSRRPHDGGTNPRRIQDFPAQANGAEIMRLAVIWGVEAGLPIGGIVHDAIVLCSPRDLAEDHIALCQYYMQKAGEVVLDGFKLFSEVKRYSHPQRVIEPRGQRTWDLVQSTLQGLEVGV
jgi:DNA polymerase I